MITNTPWGTFDLAEGEEVPDYVKKYIPIEPIELTPEELAWAQGVVNGLKSKT